MSFFIFGLFSLVIVKKLLMASVKPIRTLRAVASRRLVAVVVLVALSNGSWTEIDISLLWNAINYYISSLHNFFSPSNSSMTAPNAKLCNKPFCLKVIRRAIAVVHRKGVLMFYS